MSRATKGKFPPKTTQLEITLPWAYAQALGEISFQAGEGPSIVIRHMIDDYLTRERGRMGRIEGETFTSPVYMHQHDAPPINPMPEGVAEKRCPKHGEPLVRFENNTTIYGCGCKEGEE